MVTRNETIVPFFAAPSATGNQALAVFLGRGKSNPIGSAAVRHYG